MPPYSGFRVTSAPQFNEHTKVWEVTIYAYPDNKIKDLDNVPLAPWH